jgi:hypothetical protein
LILASSSILVMLALAGPTIILFGGRVRDRTSKGKPGGFLVDHPKYLPGECAIDGGQSGDIRG